MFCIYYYYYYSNEHYDTFSKYKKLDMFEAYIQFKREYADKWVMIVDNRIDELNENIDSFLVNYDNAYNVFQTSIHSEIHALVYLLFVYLFI